MAAFDTTTPVAVPSFGRIARPFSTAFHAVSAWNDTRITRNSLMKLTARELDDIGLSLGDIDVVARRG